MSAGSLRNSSIGPCSNCHIVRKQFAFSIVLALLLVPISPAFAQTPPRAAQLPTSAPAAPLSQQQIQELFRRVAVNDQANDKRQRDYTYIERVDEHKLDGKGQVRSSDIRTYEILEIYGEPVRRMIAKDEKPLAGKEAQKEEEKIQKLIDRRKDESEAARSKREQKEEKEREEDRQFVNEVADAYNFHFAATELRNGRETYVIDAEPRPGFQPHSKDAKILPHLRFRAWIDKDEQQWARLDIECIDTVSFGLFLVRLHKGARVAIEQTRVNGEVWLPQHVAVKVDLRLALFKDLNLEQDVTFRDYKKFRAATKIVPGAEIQQQ